VSMYQGHGCSKELLESVRLSVSVGDLNQFLEAVNASILTIVGYFAYRNWDRRVLSATSIGLIALLGGELCVSVPDINYRRIALADLTPSFSFDDIKRYFTSES